MNNHDLPDDYDITKYDRPSVAADIAVFTVRKKPCESYRHLSGADLSVLLVRRREPPFRDMISLPGGFCCREETIEQTAQRKLHEKTGVSGLPLSLLCNFSAYGRDPRGWIISCAYWTVVEFSCAVTDSADAAWYDVKLTEDGPETVLELMDDFGKVSRARFKISQNTELYNQPAQVETIDSGGIAFDHAEIIVRGILQLRESLEKPYAAFRLLPSAFTLSQLQQVYEAILDKRLLMSNFRRKIAPYVEETGQTETGAGHRPSKLFRGKKSDESL